MHFFIHCMFVTWITNKLIYLLTWLYIHTVTKPWYDTNSYEKSYATTTRV